MDKLIINYKASKTRRIVRTIVGLYFIAFCGYFVFAEAAIDRYDTLFYTAVVGTVLALLLFLCNTLWASNKDLIKIDSSVIESNVPSSKFKADWVSVSRVSVGMSHISFFVDGGKKERRLELSQLRHFDVPKVKDKVISLCEHKSISCSEE